MPPQAQASLETDTIVAIATPAGRGGIGIVRLSGPQSQPIAEQIVALRNPLQPGRVRYGLIPDKMGKRVDDAIVTLYRAPHSYTGEDVAEIATHGSPIVLEWVLTAATAAGARLARAGEFTERAFLLGRLDLTQAEAVGDLISAQTLAQARLAAEQVGGSLAREVGLIKQQLIRLIASLEAGIDFAEDDLETASDPAIQNAIATMLPTLQALEKSFARGRLLREGLRLAIVGKPNAGKSSLFNRLLARERAIVTPVAGTTRDVVSERLVLDGIPVELLDTAGLRETEDPVERIGVERSYQAIADADRIVLVVDCAVLQATRYAEMFRNGDTEAIANGEVNTAFSNDANRQASEIAAAVPGRPLLVVFNKVDLVLDRSRLQQLLPSGDMHGAIEVSALTGEGMDALQAAILRSATGTSGVAYADGSSAMLSNFRQHDCIAHCLSALSQASAAAGEQVPHEMVLLTLYEALQNLNELTGETTSDDVLNLIFSTFCIGK